MSGQRKTTKSLLIIKLKGDIVIHFWQNYGIYTMSKCRSMKVAQQMNNRMPIRKNG